jgi:diaminohydroxyphosphoribosylaminopyrimidine deaminase/5-amino-6-(5-phosphoribosylamino)uracil reductase
MASCDIKFMKRALFLARLGKGRVEPNPMVGAVLVKNGKVVGEGYHEYFGGPHAEINALKAAGAASRNCDLYVTLEPCVHHGKTPPCTKALVKAGVNSVFAATADPNPRVAGAGIAQLKKAGINTNVGLLREECERLLEDYRGHVANKRPHITVKMAMTLDGKIATRTGDSKWITGPLARAWVHRLRTKVDAVLVGIGTVVADNPELTSHGKGRNPVRVIIDRNLDIPLISRVLNTKIAPTIVIHNVASHTSKIDSLIEMGVLPVFVKPGKEPYFKYVVKKLMNMSVFTMVIEGGGGIVADALKAKVVDEFFQFIAPKIVGGKDAKTPVEGLGITKMHQAIPIKAVSYTKIGHDLLIKGRIK